MDLQTGLMVGGVAVAVVAVFVLVSLFRSSGTSYEEAVAEQRRATSELIALANSGNKQSLKKSKKAGKKAKEKKQKEVNKDSERDSDAPADSGLDEEYPAPRESPPAAHVKPHVEFGESTVVDGTLDKPPKPQIEKKEEVIEKKDVKLVKAAKGKHGKQPAPAVAPAPVPEPLVEEVSKEVLHGGDTAKEPKKTKKSEKRQTVDNSGDKLASEEPSPSPSQSDVTEKVVKQPTQSAAQPPATKSKKKKSEQTPFSIVGSDAGGVSVSELVRLVSEAVLSRTEIQTLTEALLNKQHGVLPQHGEWSEGPNDPVQKLKKQLAEKEKALADEQEASMAVQNKLKELRASLNTERARANAATRASEEAASASKVEIHTLQARMQRLLDDNHALTQDKHMLQSKLQNEGEVAAQRVQLEMHIQRLNETEAALVSQLGALQAELGARVLEVGQVRCEASLLAQQLQESNRMYSESEASRASLAHAEQAAREELRAAGERGAELQAEMARAALARAGAERAQEESERHCTQLSSELKGLREQLAAKEEEIKKQHSNHQQNGLSAQDDAVKKAELKKLEGVVETLKAELEGALASHAHEKQQLAELQAQLQLYRDKNNELRTKNWKVVEALQSAERLLQNRSAADNDRHEAVAAALEQQSREMAEALRAACPQAAPPGPGDKAWLASFARQLSTVLQAAGDGRQDELQDLRGQNVHLQELVDKYKKIIDDTEGVLSELQKNVTAEEGRWARMLQEKQRELDRLKQTTITQMQSKIDTLQAELERRSAPNSLADMERGLEETNRLLNISEKHPQIESLNGPSQVGFGEK